MVSQPKRVLRPAKRELNEEDFSRYVAEYLSEKATMEAIQARVNEKKAAIAKFVDANGERDEKGNIFFYVEGIEGVSAVKRERRVSTTLNKELMLCPTCVSASSRIAGTVACKALARAFVTSVSTPNSWSTKPRTDSTSPGMRLWRRLSWASTSAKAVSQRVSSAISRL